MVVRAVWYLFFLFSFFSSHCVFAQECDLVETKGLRADEFVSLAVDPIEKDAILIGTTKGLYKRDSDSDMWQKIDLLPSPGRVNQILFISDEEVCVAAQKGLYLVNLKTHENHRILTRSNEWERDCISVCILGKDSFCCGTRAGLFMKREGQKEWVKIGSPFDNRSVVSLWRADRDIYAASTNKIFKSSDKGLTWQEIFNLYGSEGIGEALAVNSENDDSGSSLESDKGIRFITGVVGKETLLYVAAGEGVSVTKDSGKILEKLPLAGLDAAGLRTLTVDPLTKNVYAAAESGLFYYRQGRWILGSAALEGRQVIQKESKLFFLTKNELFECEKFAEEKNIIQNQKSDTPVEGYENEPTIQEVHEMAIRYAEVDNEKIKDWRKKAASKAFLPQVSVGVDRNTTDLWHWEGGSTTKIDDILVRGRDSVDWDVSLNWDLGEIIYNDAQTSIDTRSKLLVELRNDILSEVTRLYFERRKLQIELSSKNEISSQVKLEKKLRIEELGALIDRLTGGHFTKVLKSTH
jgi:hypothetical protein